MSHFIRGFLLLSFFWSLSLLAATDVSNREHSSTRLEALKQNILTLNAELQQLEQDLLYPSGNQVTVFVSLDVDAGIILDSVELAIDGRRVANELYTERQVSALARGATQRLYLGKLYPGRHEVSAFFALKANQGQASSHSATVTIDKSDSPAQLQLHLAGAKAAENIEVTIKELQD